MISFLFKSFFGLLLLVFCCTPKKYSDPLKQKLNPHSIWHIFIDRVYYFNPEKINVSESGTVGYALLPGRYYDVSCSGSSSLTLWIGGLPNQTYYIKSVCVENSSEVLMRNLVNQL